WRDTFYALSVGKGQLSASYNWEDFQRDLKLENVLLDVFLNVKIADFGLLFESSIQGLSNIMKDGELMKTSCGSPNYASPEIVSGGLYFGPEVDIWSCGVILFTLICGHLPFDETNIKNLFSKIKAGDFTYYSNHPVGPKTLIYGMLEANSTERYTIEKIMNDEWFKRDVSPYLLEEFNDSSSINKEAIIERVAEIFKVDVLTVTSSLEAYNQSDPIVATYRILIDEQKDVTLYKSPNTIAKKVEPHTISVMLEGIEIVYLFKFPQFGTLITAPLLY
ncbi:hypothetical protein HZS_4305, partial [Henneguya salminicola]